MSPQNLQNSLRTVSSARSQGTIPIHKIQFQFYVLTMNRWKTKFKIQMHLQLLQKDEMLRFKLNRTLRTFIDLYAENYEIILKEIKEEK